MSAVPQADADLRDDRSSGRLRRGSEFLRALTEQYATLFPLLLAVALSAMNRLRPMQHLTYSDIAVLIAACALPLLRLKRQGSRRHASPLPFLLAPTFVLIGALLQALALKNAESVLYAGHYFVAAALIPPLILWSVIDDWKAILAVAYAWVAGIALSALVGVLAHHGIQLPGLNDPFANWYWGGFRISGLAFHPNLLALCLAMALPISVAYAVGSTRVSVRALFAGLTLMFLYALDLTGSRAALGAAIVVLPPILWVSLWRKDVVTRLTILILAGAGVGLTLLLLTATGTIDGAGAFDRLFGGEDTSHSDWKRGIARDEAIRDFLAHPVLGAGYVHIRDAHNFFLQFLQSGGVVGLIGYLCYLVLLARVIYLCRGRYDSVPARLLVIGLIGGVATWLLVGFYQNAVIERAVYVPIGLLLAIACSRRPT